MNSLDKMEDYDRLAELCEKQAQELAELREWIKVQSGAKLVLENEYLKAEIAEKDRKLAELELKVSYQFTKLRAADEMAKVCDDWVVRKVIDARSALADARLNYGQPFTSEAAAELESIKAAERQAGRDEVEKEYSKLLLREPLKGE
jgi:hypothetical protein